MAEAATERPAAERTRARRAASRSSALTFYLFLSPWLVGLLVFYAGPLVATAVLSFYDWPITGTPTPIGLDNYVRAFTRDPVAMQAIVLALKFAFTFVPLNLVLAFCLAAMLNQPIRGRSIFRAAIYLPYIIPAVAAAWVLKYMLSTNFGVVNYLLESTLGLPAVPWLTSEAWAPWTLVLVSVWGQVGPSTIINLAGLQSIPEATYEAASIDGAGRWARLWHITLPLLTPTLFFNLVMGLISAIQVFGVAYLLTGGGPGTSTLYLGYKLYNEGFINFRMGYASALAWIQFLLIAGLTLLVFKRGGSFLHYASK